MRFDNFTKTYGINESINYVDVSDETIENEDFFEFSKGIGDMIIYKYNGCEFRFMKSDRGFYSVFSSCPNTIDEVYYGKNEKDLITKVLNIVKERCPKSDEVINTPIGRWRVKKK